MKTLYYAVLSDGNLQEFEKWDLRHNIKDVIIFVRYQNFGSDDKIVSDFEFLNTEGKITTFIDNNFEIVKIGRHVHYDERACDIDGIDGVDARIFVKIKNIETNDNYDMTLKIHRNYTAYEFYKKLRGMLKILNIIWKESNTILLLSQKADELVRLKDFYFEQATTYKERMQDSILENCELKEQNSDLQSKLANIQVVLNGK